MKIEVPEYEARRTLPSNETRAQGGMAQWIVLCNGILLTLAAYFALSYYIDQSISSDYQRASSSAMDNIGSRLADLESTFRASATVLENVGNASDQDIKSQLGSSVSHIDLLGELIWIRQSPATGQTEAKKLYDNTSVNMHGLGNVYDANQISQFIQAVGETRNQLIVTYKFPGIARIASNPSDTGVMDRPIALLWPQRDQNNVLRGIVVGLTTLDAVFDAHWRLMQSNVISLTVTDQASNEDLFKIEDANRGSAAPTMANVTIGNATLALKANIQHYSGAAILRNFPIFILAFGGLLTLAGMLFVRSNRRQSEKLADINSVLARKNKELNLEITERARLNESLREADQEYRAIVDSVSDAIFETTSQGNLIFLNSAWERITGFETAQSMERNLLDMLHSHDQDEQKANFEDLVRGKKQGYRAYTRLRTRDGSFRSVEMAVAMLRSSENQKVKVVGSITDVEDRRRAERALSEAEKKYRAIVENAAGGIFQVTPDGQILSANPAMARIMGYPNTDAMLREMRNALDYLFVSGRDRGKFMRDLVATDSVLQTETQGRNKQDEKLWFGINARAVKDNDGNVLYFEGSLENITARKTTELQLREAKIQSDLASRAKSEFLANMSHELRTPLNSIIGFSEIIKNEVFGKIEHKQYRDYSSDIYDSGKRLLTIINEILDVSRIEAGERQLNETSLDIVKLMHDCLDFVEHKAEAGRIKVTNLVEGRAPSLIGEELAVKQIIVNLLSNAIKFTPAEGRVTVSYEVDREGQLLISITDTGIGLDETEIQKALSPFGQVDTSLNRSGSGTGLGLTLVDSLVKLHGGRFELFSQKGVGTTATVIFPAKRVAKTGREDAGSTTTSAGYAHYDAPTDPRKLQ